MADNWSLTQWNAHLAEHPEERAHFQTIQRQRWLARKVLNRLRYRIWSKTPQCNVELIEMSPIETADEIILTDTTHRMVYRFHQRDMFKILLAKLSYADEFLPNPHPPVNPYTNAPLTLAQTISICKQLTHKYVDRGRCPPVLFSAFCAAGYDITRFYNLNTTLLSQYAIRAYFKEVTEQNMDAMIDTMCGVLTHAGLLFSRADVIYLFQHPTSPTAIKEWQQLMCDYVLYTNLHVFARRNWTSLEQVHEDVRALWQRTRSPTRRVFLPLYSPSPLMSMTMNFDAENLITSMLLHSLQTMQ